MKILTFASLLAIAGASAAQAAPALVPMPVGACLEKISSRIEALGMSADPEENRIDFESVLDVRGKSWTIQYYKILPGDPRVLGVVGTATLRVEITRATRDGRVLEVSDCRVYGAKIVSESRK